jgi:hypothetical protein
LSDIQAKLRAEFRGQTSSRVAYATSRIALPEPSSNAEWTEDAAFKAGDAILANPSLKAFCTRLRKLYGSDIPESGKLDVE